MNEVSIGTQHNVPNIFTFNMGSQIEGSEIVKIGRYVSNLGAFNFDEIEL